MIHKNFCELNSPNFFTQVKSYLDKSFKDGTTLLTDEEIDHETF